ncbi:MAG: hypothetical protein L0Z50_05880 [Verrucomicrobiales bacterium]|nr:hypothetical protein [Verrucomicrobiales bacterium]
MNKPIRCISLALLACGTASAQNATVAARFTVEHPTLLNLGFEWAIVGDANRDAEVAVQFRAVGEASWRPAMPLVRIGGERIFRAREHLDYTVPEGFAGSILNLQPGTEYECRFSMTDPDGVTGEASPPDFDGPRQEPSFTGILQAYYGAGLGDWSLVWEQRAQPGDTLLMHAGLYRVERLDYVDPMMTPFDGTMSLTLKGELEKPITIRAAGDGEVVLDGDDNHCLFDVMASRYHIFEELTFRNADYAIFAGRVRRLSPPQRGRGHRRVALAKRRHRCQARQQAWQQDCGQQITRGYHHSGFSGGSTQSRVVRRRSRTLQPIAPAMTAAPMRRGMAVGLHVSCTRRACRLWRFVRAGGAVVAGMSVKVVAGCSGDGPLALSHTVDCTRRMVL